MATEAPSRERAQLRWALSDHPRNRRRSPAQAAVLAERVPVRRVRQPVPRAEEARLRVLPRVRVPAPLPVLARPQERAPVPVLLPARELVLVPVLVLVLVLVPVPVLQVRALVLVRTPFPARVPATEARRAR